MHNPQRCLHLSGGAHTPALVLLTNDLLSEVYSAASYAINQLRSLCGILTVSTSASTPTAQGNNTTAGATGATTADDIR